jgi:transposase
MNQLKMDIQQTISTLSRSGWSQRRIARELGIDRETVARYRRLARQTGEPEPAISPAGSEPSERPNPAIVPAGSEGTTVLNRSGAPPANPAIPPAGSEPVAGPNPAIVPPGPEVAKAPSGAPAESSNPAISPTGSKPGRVSHCEPFESFIKDGLDAGLSAQRIYQDLVSEQKFTGSYDSVKRFVRQLDAANPLPFRRMESEPGHEAQVDFGQGAWVVEDGHRRRPHVLRVVLSHSRKGYTEAFWRQTTENFVRGLENALRHFGGVVRTLVIDNLRAAVKKVDWFEPELNPKVVSFCEHYGTVILPTKPAMPRHKGKIEAGIKYVQENGLAGKQFESLGAQNLHLAHWEETVADTRIHGTTRQQVRAHFLTVEKPKLLPLPAGLFPVFSEAPRTIHRDGYAEVDKAYYSAPPEYVRRKVWARWDSKMVRLFNERMEPIAVHVRQPPGKFKTDPAHIHDHKRTLIERGAEWILDRCWLLGPGAGTWAESLYQQRGAESLRVLQGLLALAEKHPTPQLDQACQLALTHGAWRLRDLRELLVRPMAQEQFAFIETHPLIRDLSAYDNLVPVCFKPVPQSNPQPSLD